MSVLQNEHDAAQRIIKHLKKQLATAKNKLERTELVDLKAQIKVLREALEFYAGAGHRTAREALEKTE